MPQEALIEVVRRKTDHSKEDICLSTTIQTTSSVGEHSHSECKLYPYLGHGALEQSYHANDLYATISSLWFGTPAKLINSLHTSILSYFDQNQNTQVSEYRGLIPMMAIMLC